MSLGDEYKKQFAWRDWQSALDLCPIASGQRVLDLGCGPGDLSLEISIRGATVTGVDSNDELLSLAKIQCPTSCTFQLQDLNQLDLEKNSFDGLWCSFTAAYFTNFQETLNQWIPFLTKDAWICITEIDNLLGHEPISNYYQQRIEDFYHEAYSSGRYDFLSGNKLKTNLEKHGYVVNEIHLRDKELAFDGSATPEVLTAWSNRLERMGGLKKFLGHEYQDFKIEFLASLSNKNHRSHSKVITCIGEHKALQENS